MTPPAPTLHSFDPANAGMVGLRIDAITGITQVDWYVGAVAPGGPYTKIATTYPHTGFNGLSVIVNASATTYYWVAKVTDSTGTSPNSADVQAVPSAGPPVLSDVQMVNAALGISLVTGDKVNVYPATPTTVQTVNADGSIS